MDRFEDLLNDVETRIKDNKHVTKIFDELKGLQKELRDIAFTRDHRNKLWQRIDTAFKEVKEKRFGSRGDSGGGGNSPVQRITSRYNGLMNAIDKMERSIKRDDDDLEFQQRKINRTDGQLEAQIRQAKIQMIEQRVNSKREKLEEMLATKIQLEAKIEKEKPRQVKREAQAQKEAARQEAEAKAKEKIAEDIRRQQENLATEGIDLTSAAEAINEQKNRDKAKAKPVKKQVTEAPKETAKETTEKAKEKSTVPQESLLGAIGTTLSESLEDVMDTIKAVAEVVSQQIEDKVDEIKHDFAEATKSEEE
jgi:chemotaxis protein histidine kinase CheA